MPNPRHMCFYRMKQRPRYGQMWPELHSRMSMESPRPWRPRIYPTCIPHASHQIHRSISLLLCLKGPTKSHKMATPTQSQLRSLYRRIIRELPSHHRPTHASILSHPSTLQTQIRATLATTPRSPTTGRNTTPISRLTAASIADAESPSAKFNAESGIHAKTVEQMLQEGEQFVAYVQAQRQYLSLIERYNPGMNMDEEERVRLSARRVGMNLPIDEFGNVK